VIEEKNFAQAGGPLIDDCLPPFAESLWQAAAAYFAVFRRAHRPSNTFRSVAGLDTQLWRR
jgi:hypothetical protein